MSAAALQPVPSLTLVRPRRGQADTVEDAPVVPLSRGVRSRTTHAPVPGAVPDQSDHASSAADDTSLAGGPTTVLVREGRSTPQEGASHTSAGTDDAPERVEALDAHPLPADDRALLASMAPAIATALVEVLVGARAPVSIEKWLEPSLFERILVHTRVRQSLSQGNPHEDRPLAVSAARISEVTDSVVEIALVVRTTRRPRAVALRLTRRRSRWKLSEFLSI